MMGVLRIVRQAELRLPRGHGVAGMRLGALAAAVYKGH
eukprot:CAMPEP_0176027450 /NCGR_PEP_ID=MMETSP0120_2-20121206/13461_1 /TAXON_ID=160619 /ORGANISM="Kryptoperidinium foliaceum, Strain CCMP 1326" /LENGTH=37 /DNA_ID= /DNA_START= /DNA_END= /DNA_ORIENTATION=